MIHKCVHIVKIYCGAAVVARRRRAQRVSQQVRSDTFGSCLACKTCSPSVWAWGWGAERYRQVEGTGS